ncbi:MAG: hypothetical protein WBN75_13565 [Verrucomicrobiia bacterium]
MPNNQGREFRHFLFEGGSQGQSFTTPRQGRGGVSFPTRNRQMHASRLRAQLQQVQQRAEQILHHRQATGLATEFGLVIEFASDPGFPLNVDSLERRRSRIQLLNVRKKVTAEGQEITLATVRVPYGKLAKLVRLVEAYQNKDTNNEDPQKRKPKNEALIATIAEIRIAALEAFWTEEKPMPQTNDNVAWEAWLHIGEGGDGRDQVLHQFFESARQVGVHVSGQRINLPENTVLLIHATRLQLESSLDLLNCLTELREPQVTAEFFTAMNPVEQRAWVDDALRRISWPPESAPAVCLLDTGVNQGHPLLSSAISLADLHAYDPTWGVSAIIQSKYSRFWPETIRALMVHSAEWTPTMLGNRIPKDIPKAEWPSILRKYGYGKPNLASALYSARSAATLICQDEIQPFILEGSDVKTNELRFHTLPWPREVLLYNATLDAEMSVTLSYFIEPNPGPRQTNDRYRYASCGLRFDVSRQTESEQEFRARINREARDENDRDDINRNPDSDEWTFGANLRHRGSIHTDTWHGTAAQLAEKSHIAVFPVNGWWRLRKHLKRYDSHIRYSLVVTIRTSAQNIDIYTPIETQIRIAIPVR